MSSSGEKNGQKIWDSLKDALDVRATRVPLRPLARRARSHVQEVPTATYSNNLRDSFGVCAWALRPGRWARVSRRNARQATSCP